ncbi:RNA polymerase factor sigma-32 [Pontivivens ytuae]|uniref:RNA polymerase factor sigma-32 n=1 Tax=Pontivivens ytuae TaxID=2789856 RepID=A0A7S9LU54_9RHOB|nr:RNA polymerase factor sigma-32 [Pontivivens ytuae]QPH55174.1 RNA polymerase factor sigma-32 [Pontivivens ytuae]
MALDDSVSRSVTRQAMGAEMLDAETELMLARAWRDEGCEKSLHRLVNAYMRLAVSMASKYRRYGASMPDLIQEAGVGLMKAAEKFDPDRGVRFSTYAVWWIKASIQDYVMRNWSMVRTGSTSSQKALFFNLRRVKAKLEREAKGEAHISSHELREMIADEVGVPLRDVEMMEARLSGSDFSLNAQQAGDEGREWVEALEDEGPRAEETVSHDVDLIRVRGWIADAMEALSAREKMIVIERKMRDDPRTLESLGNELGLSKERIRQLEAQALKKLRKRLEAANGATAEMLALA